MENNKYTTEATVITAATSNDTQDDSFVSPITENTIRKFLVSIPDYEIIELRKRIMATRWPGKETVIDQSQGVQLDKLQALLQYWGTDYNWRKVEAKLNALPQFLTNIDGLDIHFIHVRSKEQNALPVIITHGWPGSIIELLKVIDPLTNPTAHQQRAEDAFDVIIPSIPGYGFSGKPQHTGWDPSRIAKAWHELVRRLGYNSYVAQGSDWGSVITNTMALQQPEGLLGIHVNMPATVPTDVSKALKRGDPLPEELSEKEKAAFKQLDKLYKSNTAHAAIMGTRPQTLGYGLEDSPAGLAAFFLDKLTEWTYSGDPEKSIGRDEILDNISLFWFTQTATSAARLYWENRSPLLGAANILLPSAITIFPGEIYQAPKSWAELGYPNLIYFNEVDKGGHFPAWEEPQLFSEELRAAFRSLRHLQK